MKEEVFLEQKFGKRIPFSVPDGFFKEFEENLLKAIPDKTVTPSKHIMPKLIKIISAACIIFAVLSVYTYSHKDKMDIKKQYSKISNSLSNAVYTDYIIDEVSDYTLLDNYDLYSYIADE